MPSLTTPAGSNLSTRSPAGGLPEAHQSLNSDS